MTTSVSTRYVRPWGGVFHWLDREDGDPVRRLYVHLVLAGAATPLNMEQMAAALQLTVRDVAKALFAFNREEGVSVLDEPPDESWAAQGLASMNADLESVATDNQSLVLATDDGLLVAYAGIAMAQAEVVAAWPGTPRAQGGQATWQNQTLRAGNQRFRLWWTGALDARQPGLLCLLSRLLLSLGEQAPSLLKKNEAMEDRDAR